MRYAGEVFSGGKALPAGDTELSREDRKRARAAKKRASKNRRAQQVRSQLNEAPSPPRTVGRCLGIAPTAPCLPGISSSLTQLSPCLPFFKSVHLAAV